MDIDILRAVSKRDNWERFLPLIKEHTVSKYTWLILKNIQHYYDNYPSSTTVDVNSFRTLFFIINGEKIKETDIYNTIFDNWSSSDYDGSLSTTIVEHLIEKDYATRIYNEVVRISTGDKKASLHRVAEWVEEYEKEVAKSADDASIFVPASLDYLREATVTGGLSWRLKELQISLGRIRRGDFLIFAARPETGKTTMMCSEATNMLDQLAPDEHIIWINNEESSNKVMMRAIQAMAGCTTKELLDNPAYYESKFKEKGGDRFLIIDDDAGMNEVTKINRLLKEYKPGLIIIDQLDKVEGFSNEARDDLRIGKLYMWARQIAKTYCPVIAVSQVDGTGEGEKWIYMNQLRGSKTDKIGEADAIVTIGKSNEPGMDLHRFIHVPKNKLLGDDTTLEAHRHGTFEVAIDPSHARYISKWK